MGIREYSRCVTYFIYCLAFTSSLLGAQLSEAATYCVATTGNDANSGTVSNPFKSINRAVKVLKPGDILYVRSGTYAEAVSNIPGGTSWITPVTVSAYTGETVTLKPNSGSRVIHFQGSDEKYIIINGFILDGSHVGDVVKITNNANEKAAHHIRIMNSELRNATNQGVLTNKGSDFNEFINLKVYDNGKDKFEHGLYIGSSHNLIENCEIYRNAGFGIHLYNAKGNYSNNNILRNNRIYNNGLVGGQGIIISKGSSSMVYNNVVYNNLNGGIRVDYGGSNAKIYNNTIYNNAAYGINLRPGSSHTIVRNNISYNNSGKDLLDTGSNNTKDYNLVGKNPQFVNAAAADFRLNRTSPAINKGMTLSEVVKDFNGVLRPQGTGYEIGAYEYISVHPD